MIAAFPSKNNSRRGRGAVWMLAPVLAVLALALCLATPARAEKTDHPAGAFNFCYQGNIPETRVLVVDLARQRLMVLNYLGEMTLEYEYPCATGANPGGKENEGDERTPVGIYFTTHRFKDRKITIFGDRAIHLNYPNPMDRAAGRKGNGIFIHGTNQPFKPRSTNGCIVVRNEDLAVVSKLIKEQLTPVVVVEHFELPNAEQRNLACNYLLKLESFPSGHKSPDIDPVLALRGTDNHQKFLTTLAPRLHGLLAGHGARVAVHNRGLMLLGLGDQWVLVADQDITGPHRHTVRVTRRFYLDGQEAAGAKLVRGEWVLPDLASADRLAAWAPRSAPKPAHTAGQARAAGPERQVHAMLHSWLQSWRRKELNLYISHYARGFHSGGMDRRAWRRQKAYLNRVYKKINVKVKDLKISVNGSRAQVSFKQFYRSDWHRDVGIKKLELVKERGKWRILSETWEKLPGAGNRSTS